jgi:DNA primase catalytic core
MARIPEAELERIKREVDLVALVTESGVKLNRQGQDWAGLCCWHEDHEPSLVVSPEKDPPLWHCLGACQTGGSAIDWVMRRDRLSFREAVAVLQRQLGGPAIEEAEPAASLPPIVELWMGEAETMAAVVAYYRETLAQTPEALRYLERRGLGSPELVEHFQLGYSDRSLGLRLPVRRTVNGTALRERLEALGLFRCGSGHEHMRGRVVVPLFDRAGTVVDLYGRVIRSNLHASTPNHLNLPGPLRGVFNREALALSKEIILCESLFDAITFWAAGFRHVTGTRGVEGFTEEHFEAFLEHGIERVLLAFDRDDAGDAGAAVVAERLMAQGIECFRIQFPRGMDANEYARRVQPAEKSLGLAIRSAQWLGKARSVVVTPSAAAPPGEELGAALPLAAPPESPAAAPPATSDLAGDLARKDPAATAPVVPAASPAPPQPGCEVAVEVRGEEVVLWLGDRRYRVRGLGKNLSFELLKVNLLASRGDAFHVDTLDLYSARLRLGFAKQVATELGIDEAVARADVGRVLLRLEMLQQESVTQAMAPATEAPSMSEQERDEALAFLCDPHLVERLREDFLRCGVVGEEANTLVGYFAATSRKLRVPLAVLIQSSSAAGKSALLDAVLAMMPEEERVKYSAMTGQSLFYMSEQDLRHKILALVEEEGAQRASYALKLLQSEGELTIASTGKDPQNGRLVTHEYRVEGPVAILLTTTAVDIDEELLNRCLILTVDENREQTRAIHRQQRESWTLAGFLREEEREAILARHRNAQRLLRPQPVLNPYAPKLEFLDTQVRTRRDHKKYLGLIAAIAFLHQHQRRRVVVETKRRGAVECVEVALSDIALANRLAHEVLGRTLDELPPQTRRLLELLDALVTGACGELAIDRSNYRFLLRQVREWTGWGQTQLRLHLLRLVDLEYIVVHRGGRGQTFVYELVYQGGGKDGRPFLPKLIDVESLERRLADGNLSGLAPHLSGSEGDPSGSNRPAIGPESGSSRTTDSSLSPSKNGKKPLEISNRARTAALPRGVTPAPYLPPAS